VTDDKIKAAVRARIAAEEAPGIPPTVTDPAVLAALAAIIEDADKHRPHK
jgi:hypothetical protein